MARRRQFPPKPHGHAASGQERVRYKGKDFYLGPIGSDEARREYARLLSLWTQGREAGPRPATTLLNVGEVWAAFWADATASRDHREVRAFEAAFAVVLARYAELPADKFDSLALLEIQRDMASKWVRTVTNRQIVRVRTVFRWAEARRLIGKGSWEHLRTVPGLRKHDRGVTHPSPRRLATFKEVKTIALACSPSVCRALLLQWYTGMRSIEVRLMRPADVQRAGPVWFYRPPAHKGAWREEDAGRVVALGPRCQALLRGLLDGDQTRYVFSPPKRGKVRRKPCYDEWTYAQHVHRAAVSVGLGHFRPYDCRHAAKQRFTRLFGLDGARAMLGQKSLGTTNQYGLQLDTETAARVAAKVG